MRIDCEKHQQLVSPEADFTHAYVHLLSNTQGGGGQKINTTGH